MGLNKFMEAKTPDGRDTLLEAAVDRLSEHFDTVQILATAHQADGHTLTFECGCGNTLARTHQARMFSIDNEIKNLHQRRE